MNFPNMISVKDLKYPKKGIYIYICPFQMSVPDKKKKLD